MAQFTPSKKTIKDFNDGEEYLNRIDVVQADTINNLVEGLLYAQKHAESDEYVKKTGDTITGNIIRQGSINEGVNVPSFDIFIPNAGSTHYGFNGIKRYSGSGNNELIFPFKDGTLLVDKDLKDYINKHDNEQTIDGQFIFVGNDRLQVSESGYYADEVTSYNEKNITRYLEQGVGYTYTFPQKSGTLLVDQDLANYVTTNTSQTGNNAITGIKEFTHAIRVSETYNTEGMQSNETKEGLYYSDAIITYDTFAGQSEVNRAYVHLLQNKVGIIAHLDDIPTIPNISISNSGSGNAVTAITASGHTITVTKGATYAGTSTATSSANGLMSSTDKSHLDSMWNIWSADGTSDTLVNKVQEVLSAFSSFKEGDTIVGLLSNKADKVSLNNYVTLDTEQRITGKKIFVDGALNLSDQDGDMVFMGGSFIYTPDQDGIPRYIDYPIKSGRLVVDQDLANYVTTNTEQNITSKKTFSQGAQFNQRVTANLTEFLATGFSAAVSFDYSGIRIYNAKAGGGYETRNTVTYPTENGRLALKEEITWSNMTGKPTSLKNPYSLSITANGTTVTYDGSSAKSITIPSGSSYSAGTGIAISTANVISTIAASQTASGHVSTAAQSFSGLKNFYGGVNIMSGVFQIGGGSGKVGQVLCSNGPNELPSWASPALDIFRVGYVYISYSSTSPASMFGGSWTELPNGTFLMAAGSGGTAGQTGGSNTHTLTVEEMPSHNHAIHTSTTGWLPADGIPRSVIKNSNYYSGSGTATNGSFSDQFGTEVSSSFISGAGGGKSFSTMPKHQTSHIWRRTA